MRRLSKIISTVLILSLFLTACDARDSESHKDKLLAEVINRLDRGSELGTAGSLLEELLEIDAANPAVHVEHARYIMKTSGASRSISNSARVAWPPGVMDKTKAALDQALKLDPDRADTLVLYGYVAMQRREYSDALKMLRHADKIGTDNPWLYVNWADTLMEIATEQKDSDAEAKAMVYFEKALERSPPHPQTSNSAADSLVAYYLRTGDLDKAEAVYHKVLEITDNSARAHHTYANFLMQYRGDADAAFEHAEKARDGRYAKYQSKEIMARALCLKASRIMAETGDRDQAQPLFEQAERLYPDYAEFAFDATWLPVQRVMLKGMSQYGVDIFADEDNRQISIIHMAVMRNDIELTREILALGGNPNQPNADNGTPLHAALFHSGPDMVDLLLSHGADPTTKYRDGRTPIEIVERFRGPNRERYITSLTTAIEQRSD